MSKLWILLNGIGIGVVLIFVAVFIGLCQCGKNDDELLKEKEREWALRNHMTRVNKK